MAGRVVHEHLPTPSPAPCRLDGSTAPGHTRPSRSRVRTAMPRCELPSECVRKRRLSVSLLQPQISRASSRLATDRPCPTPPTSPSTSKPSTPGPPAPNSPNCATPPANRSHPSPPTADLPTSSQPVRVPGTRVNTVSSPRSKSAGHLRYHDAEPANEFPADPTEVDDRDAACPVTAGLSDANTAGVQRPRSGSTGSTAKQPPPRSRQVDAREYATRSTDPASPTTTHRGADIFPRTRATQEHLKSTVDGS